MAHLFKRGWCVIIDVALNEEYDSLIEDFVMYICKQYSILPRRVSIEGYDLVGNRGMCFDDDIGEYTILVKPSGDMGTEFTTVAHEMIHVKQYMTQDLGNLLDKSTALPYESRWWEEEAFENAVPLVESFAKSIKLFG